MKKRFLSVLLTLFMMLAVMPVTAYAVRNMKYCDYCNGELREVYISGYQLRNSNYHYVIYSCTTCNHVVGRDIQAHSFSGTATCTTGRICDKCGYEYGALGHNYISTVTQAPTCTQDGVRTYVCKNDSSHTYTEPIPAAHDWNSSWSSDENNHWHVCNVCTAKDNVGEHIWNSGIITTSPTCTTAGERAYTCSECGRIKTEVISATGHDFVHHEAQGATCTEIGWNAYDTCENCDYTTYQEVAATGHSFGDWETVTSPNCTDKGSENRTCPVCQTVETRDVNPNGHSWESEYTVEKEATCEEDGRKSIHCSKCDTVKDVETITATGHDLKAIEKKTASCTEAGYEAYWKCNTCGKLFSDETGKTEIKQSEEIKATGHSYGEAAYKWSADNQKCTAERKCTACGNVESETAATTAKVVQEKNCILPELTTYSVTFKNDVFKSQTKENVQTAEAAGHDLKKVEKKEAGCTEAGYEAYWKCNTCGKLFSDETGKTEIKQSEEIKATGHSYGEAAYKWSADNQKCTAERKCTACGNVESETATTTAKVVQEKNCTLPELTTYSVRFENAAFESQTKENVQTEEAAGHDLEKVEKKESSCTEDGYETYWKCHTCGSFFSDEAGTTEISNPVEIKATGHDLKKVEKKEASCTEDGYEAYWRCQTCKKLFSDEAGKTEISNPIEIKATGHDLKAVEKKEASCTEAGYEAYWKCQTCKKLFSDEAGTAEISNPIEIKATGHDLEKVEKKEASCTEAGYEAYWRCQTCKKLFSDEAGTAEISNPIEIKATGHNLEKVEKKDATAEKEGNSTYWFCAKCNKYFSDEKAENEIKKEDTVLAKLSTVSKKATETESASTTDKTTNSSPKTGDSTDVQLYVILMLVSIGAAAGVGAKRKFKTRR